MKLGLVSAIADTMGYEEMIDLVAQAGLECIEVAYWPAGKAERRYAGVSHIDADRVLGDDAYAQHLLDYAAQKGIEISSLAYHPNTMDADLDKRTAAVEHLKKLICASAKLGTTFIGRDQTKTVEENLELVREVWPPIIALAEAKGVKITIENCPMLFGADQWQDRSEPHDHACHLAQGLRDSAQRKLGTQLRPLALCLADDRLHPAAL